MGIGMGEQGVIRCKADMRPILMNTHGESAKQKTWVEYSCMQVRYHGDAYACISAIIIIHTQTEKEENISRIGQCASLHKLEGSWKINMVMATPLSMNIQNIDAYPLSFAEDEIEKYRMQEQFSKLMQESMTASYKINFENGVFEDFHSYGDRCIPVKKGEDYEAAIFRVANDMLNGETRLKYQKTFSLGHIKKLFEAGKQEVTLDYEAIWPDGKFVWMRSSLRLFLDVNGKLKGHLYVMNIDEHKRKEIELTKKAELDLMTGIYNKETTKKKIEIAIELYSLPFTGAFFMIDLDRFKEINDTYGHAKGDEVIKEAAEILRHVFRKEDIVGRFGGDEFGVYYIGENQPEKLAQVAEEICSQLSSILPAKASQPGTSASVGIARRMGEETFDQLYQRADEALYIRKKRQGRNGYTFYEQKGMAERKNESENS